MNADDLTAAAIAALDTVAGHARRHPEDAAVILDSVHATYGQPSLIASLVEILDAILDRSEDIPGITPFTLEVLRHHLDEAVSAISGAGHDRIDRARAELDALNDEAKEGTS